MSRTECIIVLGIIEIGLVFILINLLWLLRDLKRDRDEIRGIRKKLEDEP